MTRDSLAQPLVGAALYSISFWQLCAGRLALQSFSHTDHASLT